MSVRERLEHARRWGTYSRSYISGLSSSRICVSSWCVDLQTEVVYLTELPSHLPSVSARALQVGLETAGKTTILYKLMLGEIVTTTPMIGKLLLYAFGAFDLKSSTQVQRCDVQVSASRPWSTRTAASLSGIFVLVLRYVRSLRWLLFCRAVFRRMTW